MEIEELKEAKRELREDMLSLIEVFEKKTGVKVENITLIEYQYVRDIEIKLNI